MSPILKLKEKLKPEITKVLYRAPTALAEELDRAAKSAGISRNEAMTQYLRYALDEEKKDAARKAKK